LTLTVLFHCRLSSFSTVPPITTDFKLPPAAGSPVAGAAGAAGAIDQKEEKGGTDESSQPAKQGASKQNKWTRKMKKSPHAPKRFKSSYIFFSAQKHKEIQLQLARLSIQEKVRAGGAFSYTYIVVEGVFAHQDPSSSPRSIPLVLMTTIASPWRPFIADLALLVVAMQLVIYPCPSQKN
jgi:hypothetical protein